MSHRHEQLESTLKRAVQRVLARGLADPRAHGAMITVTGLRLGADLRIAKVQVSIYPEAKEKLAFHALRHAAAHIRHQVSDEVAMKQTPQIAFELDPSIKKTSAVLEALAKVAAERNARAGSAGDGNNPPEAPVS